MKRNETKTTLPNLKTSMNSENNTNVNDKKKRKKKKINSMGIPLAPKNQNSIDNRSNMTKVDNNNL